MDMKYWERFENSGRVEDYLAFVSEERQGQAQNAGWALESSHAGIYMGDGDYPETGSGRGVRQTY